MKSARLFLPLCFILLAFSTYELSTFSLNQSLPFDADEAHHASRGLDVYDGVRQGSVQKLYAAITDQSFYPPLHSLTVAASYAVFDGPSLISSRLPSWIAFILSLFVTALAVRATLARHPNFNTGKYAPYGMGVATLLGFFSPLSLQNASVCMLEPLSMLMTATILYVFARYENELHSSGRAALLFGFIFALAILTKYTLLIFVVAPALAALWGIPALTPKLAHKSFLIAAATVLACFGLWLAVSHWEGVWYFLFGFPKRGIALSLSALLTQPQMFIYRCALYPAIAVAAIAAAVASLAWMRQQRVILFSVLCIFTTLAVLGISRQQGGRFMLHALPCMWLLCGVGVARLTAMRRATAVIPWAVLIVIYFAAVLQRERLHTDILRALETTPAAQQMLSLVVQNAEAHSPILQIGSNDRFNIESVRWALAANSGIPFREITVDQFPMTVDRLKNLRYAQPWRAPYDKYRSQLQSPLKKVLDEGAYKTLIVFEGERWLRKDESKAEIAALLAAHPHKTWTDGMNTLTIIQF